MTEAILDQALLDELVARIVEAVRPEKVILFGSWAKGTARPDSDIDLFIQVPGGADTAAASARAYAAIRPLRSRLRRGVDIVVKDRAYVEYYGDLVGTVVRPVLREGRLLYAS
jgi:predicted nucleotidyltransferase